MKVKLKLRFSAPGGGGGNSSLGMTGTCHQHLRGRPILKDFRSIFQSILRLSGGGAKPVKIPNNQVSFHFKGKFLREPPFMDFYFRAFQNNCAEFVWLLWKSFRLNHLGFHIVA